MSEPIVSDSTTPPRATRLHARIRRLITTTARTALVSDGRVTDALIADVCEQIGVHPRALRVHFPTEDDLLDAVNDDLVDECAARLRGGVAGFEPRGGGDDVQDAAVALATSRPLDRSCLVIRANRRLRVIQRNQGGDRALIAERRFLGALIEILGDLMSKLGREFRGSPDLAVRVVLDTYERSFEAWVLRGGSESDFDGSPYVRRTLPALLEVLSQPARQPPAAAR